MISTTHMANKIQLKGITWGHSRGLLPMVATAQRYEELHPNVEILWKKRTLQEFADKSIEQLAAEYDLLVIDHPWTGHAAAKKIIVPFDDHLDAAYLTDQKWNSVGQSYPSYNFEGKQWALPIDAATPVAASRPDLLASLETSLPKTFADVLALADQGRVAFSLLPIDVLMSFYMFCCSLGEDPCQQEDEVISSAVGIKALQHFKSLADRVDARFYEKNPFMVFEDMVNNDEIAYCPFAYGYSNYAREGYARKLLHFHDLAILQGSEPMTSTLGGAGLAISANCTNVDIAMDYAQFVGSAPVQATLYVDNGGQPGHLKAWESGEVNRRTSNFFQDTLPTLQRAFLRPRYFGHMHFQDHAGDVVVEYLKNGGDEQGVLNTLNEMYKESRLMEDQHG
ncbi:carbohydrate ABC transporter substrate-binding protein (CUT1 family) [Sphingobacterium paludis]|uniref:Carbohydrate ABC transporter substrate-binding protein (CUT1 family) n=2 Tax=Sphingobacterium paludis TaxID=1476465 RepID=A0A4R7CT98_9SPHI|nr:carbohydrate ABC transporter substrate-binding protein (CUT1 family) [Sphingobacterium paludis]